MISKKHLLVHKREKKTETRPPQETATTGSSSQTIRATAAAAAIEPMVLYRLTFSQRLTGTQHTPNHLARPVRGLFEPLFSLASSRVWDLQSRSLIQKGTHTSKVIHWLQYHKNRRRKTERISRKLYCTGFDALNVVMVLLNAAASFLLFFCVSFIHYPNIRSKPFCCCLLVGSASHYTE